MKALLIVDVQKDFLPNGKLGVKDGNKIIPILNQLMEVFPIVIASKDWHPVNTVHFDSWPIHCVANTDGAAFPESLNSNKIQKIFYKGTDNKDDGYSAFEATTESLSDYLTAKGIDQLYITGIATDYCVKASAIDAIKEGLTTYVITDAVKAVNIQPKDGANALQELQDIGCILIHSDNII